MAKVNGVITLSEWNRVEKIEDLQNDFYFDNGGKELWKKYCMSNDDEDLKAFREAEDKYVKEHLNK